MRWRSEAIAGPLVALERVQHLILGRECHAIDAIEVERAPLGKLHQIADAAAGGRGEEGAIGHGACAVKRVGDGLLAGSRGALD